MFYETNIFRNTDFNSNNFLLHLRLDEEINKPENELKLYSPAKL